jgi:hypothetical protein
MKTVILSLIIGFELIAVSTASVPDAVLNFKTEHTIVAGEKILKIEIDANGDGKNEVLLSLKSDFEENKENHEPAGWSFYIRENTPAVAFAKSTGTETAPNELSVDDIPQIDHERCFVGEITELGKRGIVTIRYNNPREGPSIGIIYAYTIEGNHLKKTELARFPVSDTPHALFTKYLADDKRTAITPVEITP